MRTLSQPYWVRDLGGSGNEHIADIQIDIDGSIYVTGEFGGTVTFGGQSYSSAGGIDLFIARLTPTGDVTWFKHGGGPGIDRGLKLAIGGDVVAFTGEFMNTATFLGNSITSSGGTADMFVAVLNRSDGSLQWIEQGGGATGTDRPSGISIAGNGTVCVAGEFRGTAEWQGTTITSMTDPDTNQPSTDVFVASYSSTGDLTWLKKGTAKFTDRAVDLIHDATGNIYVTGQFSDTLTFDLAHPNNIMNATFLLKLDGSGNEVWFRRAGGAGYNHVRDMVLGPSGQILLTGDVQGTMIYFGTTQTNVSSGLAFAYYILNVSSAGELASFTTKGSVNEVASRALAVNTERIVVYGEFNCQFTSLAAHYSATGLFMATGDEDLFITEHALTGLGLQDAQQFGGRSAKAAGAIGLLPSGDAVFCGSFQDDLIFPSAPGLSADISTSFGTLQGTSNGLYCGDNNYGMFSASVSAGLTDGFVARGLVASREPYDWWRREGAGCVRDTLQPCIRQGVMITCPDTLRDCGSVSLNVLTHFPTTPGGNVHHVGPSITYLWSTGSTNSTIAATSTGNYSVTITSANGCYQWTDEVYVIIDPIPPSPLISDDIVQNTNTSSPTPIYLCDPETHWVWATNINTATEFTWQAPQSTDPIYNDSILVDTSGFYTFTITNAFGCTRTMSVQVYDNPTIALPDIDLSLLIDFPQDVDLNDSISVCPGTAAQFEYTPVWTINGLVAPLPQGLSIYWGLAPAAPPPTIFTDGSPGSGTIPVTDPGWYSAEIYFMVTNQPCGQDTLEWHFADSVHVDLFSTPTVDVFLDGPNVICDGDTILLVGGCTGCDQTSWSGPGSTSLSPDSILAYVPGTYSFSGSAVNAEGCSASDQASITVTMPTGAVLSVTPANGIICPGATATITTSLTGTSHIWYGPNGPIMGQGGSLSTNVPGEYYLSMLVGGCPVTSNNVLLSNYGTPYLNSEPNGALCYPNEEVTLLVVATPGSTIQWQSPLSGSSATQIISESGTYSCIVTACGITTSLSVDITYSPITAGLLDPGPFTQCPGETVQLESAQIADSYLWLPTMDTTSSIIVDEGGTYSLIVWNEVGCSDTVNVLVNGIEFSIPIEATGDTICSGDQAQLTAIGTGTITWYPTEGGFNPFGTGHTIAIPFNMSTVIFAQQSLSNCISEFIPVPIDVIQRPAAITVIGPDPLCLGEPFTVSTSAPDTVVLTWSTPTGTFTGPSIDVPVSTLADNGAYICTPSYEGCNGPADAWTVIVHDPIDLEQPSDVDLCTGAIVQFSIPSEFTDVQWSNGSTAHGITITAGTELTVTAIDTNGCASFASVIITEAECPLTIPNVFTPNSDGTNDTWLAVGGFTMAGAKIYNRWGNLVYEGDMLQKPWNGKHYISSENCTEGVYYYELQLTRSNGSSSMHTGYIQLLN
jgi:gliding motility-associated-like protein